MKKLLLVLAMFVAITSLTFASDYTGGTATATATFDCQVIAPLHWEPCAQIAPLEEVVKGTIRDITDVVVTFHLTGEAGKNFTFSHTGPDEVGGVALVGAWNNPNGTYGMVAGGWDATYTVDKIDAQTSGTATTGLKVYTLKVTAEYVAL